MTSRRTKIVATLGPASNSPEVLEQLILAGMDVARLNFSHGSPAEHKARALLVREIAAKHGRFVALLGDLQGPKIRIAKFANKRIELKEGDKFRFSISHPREAGTQDVVCIDYPDLITDCKAGDELLLDDGRVEMRVDSVGSDELLCTVLIGGPLSDHKGINRRGGGLTAPALTDKDRADIKLAAEMELDYLAVSFPRDAADMHEARRLRDESGGTAWLIAKIERAEAIPNLEDILRVSDGIMVARGDLAIEVGNAAVPALQKRMIKMARAMDKLVITATQMMESMILNPVPTRAEVSDVANAVLDGTDAVMLSAETAAGNYPLETIEEMANICLEAEKAEYAALDADFSGKTFTRIDQSIAMGALFTAHHLGAKAIVALTDSGSTPLWMSRHDIRVPIYALTPRLATQRKMALYRNVRPLLMDTSADRDTALEQAEGHLLRRDIVQSGDVYAITCGEPMGAPGGTNMLKICRVA